RLDLAEQPLAGLRQRDAAGGAVEEAHAEPFLQRADGLAHGRQRDPGLRGRAGKGQMLGDRDEGGEFSKLEAGGHYSSSTNRLFPLLDIIKMPLRSQFKRRAAKFSITPW